MSLPTSRLLRGTAWAGLLVLVVLTSACGFHLRGHGEAVLLNINSAKVEGINPHTSFGRIVSELFEGEGIRLVQGTGEADVALKLQPPQTRREVLSVDASVHAREYSLVTDLIYQIRRRAEESFGPPQRLSVRRDLVINPNDLLGSEYEANRLQEEMYRELIQGLLFKLRSLR